MGDARAVTGRMQIQRVTRGPVATPLRVLIYGPDKVGKTTFAAAAPAPIFIGAEEGTAALDVARFPQPRRFADVLEGVAELQRAPHDYRTVALDSLDWIEPLIWRAVCDEAKKRSIEDLRWGRGYLAAADKWRELLEALDALSRARGMHVVLIAHATAKRWANPEGEDFDRYAIKLNERAGALCREWVDGLLFASNEIVTREDSGGRVKGASTGRRILRTERAAAYDAGNRWGIPDPLDLSWAAFSGAVARSLGARERIDSMLAELEPRAAERVAQTRAWLGASLRLPHELSELEQRLALALEPTAPEAQKEPKS